jgi:Domain of unknown function (DUF4349)
MRQLSASSGIRHRPRSIPVAVLLALAAVSAMLVAGCGGEAPQEAHSESATAANAPADKSTGAAPATAKPAKAARKIVYDARIDLVVDSINATEQAITALIKEYDAFLAESDHTSLAENRQKAMWRVRVPVAHFEEFASAVTRLGEVRQNHVGSQDVTEEFMDLEARIRNKREEEKRLLKHLADSTGKLEDILAVEKELTRVRGEAEQMEGRLRYLADRADLSTITIEANEWKDFKPPVAATFQDQVARTFFGSLEALFNFGKGLALVVVALAPWIPLIVIGLLAALWLIRLLGRRPRPANLAPVPRS